MKLRQIDTTAHILFMFIFTSYAIVLSSFINIEYRNYLVLFAAMAGGSLFIFLRLPLQRQALWAFPLFTIMAIRSLISDGTNDLGSVGLTSIYALGCFAIVSLLTRIKNKRVFVKTIIRRIIYAFALVSTIQMVTYFFGLPIPNLIESKGLFSYNSLSFEPSQLGRIIGISMLCYLILDRIPSISENQQKLYKSKQKVIFAFLLTILLSGSATAIFAIPVVYLLSRSFFLGIFIGIFCIVIWPLLQMIEYDPVRRTVLLLSNFSSLNMNQILNADHSGGLRIAPMLVYLDSASPTEFGFWFGYGSDGLKRFFLGNIPGLGDSLAAGFLPGFIVVHGFMISAFFIYIFVIMKLNRTTVPIFLFWAIFFTNTAWNTQIFWYGLIIIQITWAVSRETTEHADRLQDSDTHGLIATKVRRVP